MASIEVGDVVQPTFYPGDHYTVVFIDDVSDQIIVRNGAGDLNVFHERTLELVPSFPERFINVYREDVSGVYQSREVADEFAFDDRIGVLRLFSDGSTRMEVVK
jgi:hypothetical protein